MPTLCETAYQRGCFERRNHPLPQRSSYKLIEAYRSWEKRLQTLAKIEGYLATNKPIPPDVELDGWVGAEWQYELRKLPENLAHDIGWRILPAIEAVYAPAGPQPYIRDLVYQARRQAAELTSTCETSRSTICAANSSLQVRLRQLAVARNLLSSALDWMQDGLWTNGIEEKRYRTA
ncbi:MAG: hypothetical protein HQ482_02390 [Sphingomonadales bacterium]|nr:hypothetical protein [Sphingomonadales bacterium]